MSDFDLQHGLAVASRVDGYEMKLVAVFHDAVEDGACCLADLACAGFAPNVIDAIDTLTRRPRESYQAYIERVATSKDVLALTVKRADLETNLARMDAEHLALLKRYEKAKDRLEAVSCPF